MTWMERPWAIGAGGWLVAQRAGEAHQRGPLRRRLRALQVPIFHPIVGLVATQCRSALAHLIL
jgi:hypothetical protein